MTGGAADHSNVDFIPAVKPREGIDDALVAIGRRYWALDGFDDLSGRPRWVETVSSIDCREWGWGAGKAYVVAAAAVRAVLPGYTCPRCDGELALTSRSALEKITLGEQVSSCVECDESLQEWSARALDPDRLQKARQQRDREAQRHGVQQQRQQWGEQQRETLAETYRVVWLPDEQIPPAPVRTEVITLALLWYAPSPAPIGPVREWVDPLYPNVDVGPQCVADAVRAGLIQIHLGSTVDSFAWQPATFEDALAETTDDGQVPRAALTSRYYPTWATHYTPYGHSLDTAATAVREHLTSRLAPAAMTFDRQNQLVELAIEVLGEETLRYLATLIDEHNLPPVPDNHQDKLTKAVYSAARVRPLSELYNLAWRAARSAASAAQRNLRAPRVNMTTHAVNLFESYVQQALDPTYRIKPFGPKAGLELSAVTRTLFLRVLQLDPFAASVPDIESTFPAEHHKAVIHDFAGLLCDICGLPAQPGEVWLWVDVRAALDFLDAPRRAQEAGDYLDQFRCNRSRWGLGHSECGPDEGALHDVLLPSTLRGLLAWTARMLEHEWLAGTDFRALLAEAAAGTGRFAEAKDAQQ